MIVISKRQTDNLTKYKGYKVIEANTFFYTIVSDRGKVITTQIVNFFDTQEKRELYLNKILDDYNQ